ncbi:kelch repeat-containing protein [Nostoc commune NIES-4072]|uniref:Kelch repeat-containing protein n=1 Tax=Nostoc commune NIES-4072 TaxID=2005467 RepID=A0A2R5FKU5_NOSCO|nr:galactose oxidase early set domain-containing protein [Nostoc commune]BBD69606.1 kelch repeat-containing protein [Nostoc commune HK-02]GBG19392.1 kelch repeat-containing protein [Nostoc commune NIES-4072]
MPHQFDRKVPNWQSQDNQGAGLEIVDLTGTGKKDLIVFQIDNPGQLNRGLYKIGRTIDVNGVVSGGWTGWLEVPDWQSWENQGGDVAVTDLTGTGKKDLIVFQIDNAPQLNRGLYKIGRTIDVNGVVSNGWTGWLEVPDWQSWENQGGAIAVADLTGTGKKDLIVFQIDNPVGLNRGRYKIARNIDANGVVAGGWTGWFEVPNWFSFDNVGAGVAITDLDNNGKNNIIVFNVDNATTQNQGFFKIGKQIDANGNVQEWLPWYGVPSWVYWENQGAGIAVTDLTGASSHEMVVLAIDNPPNQAENQGFYQVLPLDSDPKTRGSWELLPYKSEVLPVHAALLPKGKVLFAAGSGNSGFRFNNPDLGDIAKKIYCSVVWDYAGSTSTAPKFSHPNTLRDGNGKVLDLFCGGETLLTDGRLLAAGGTLTYDVDATNRPIGKPFTGRSETMIFDSTTERWTPQVSMANGRWYPTLLTLGNGNVLIAAGLDQNGNSNRSIEIYTPDSSVGQIRTLNLPLAGFETLPAYPHLLLLQDGSVFFTGGKMDDQESNAPPYLLNITSNPIAVKTVTGLEVAKSRNQSTSVLLPPTQEQRVMIIGGAPPEGEENATDNVNIIDLSNPATAKYTPARSLLLPRVHLNVVILPDRTMFVCGGALQREGGAEGNRKITARFQSEIYDPQTDTWHLGAIAKVERMYHSVALLLPDGKVVSASGNPDKGEVDDWSPDKNEELRLEIYSPPYIFQGIRPAIGTVTEEWKYGETVDIPFTASNSIQWASLIRNGVVTHSFNTDQRLVDLTIVSQSPTSLKVTVTSNSNLAPPGWYMLFLTDINRIPSEAKWIHLD